MEASFWESYGLVAVIIAIVQTIVIGLVLEWYKSKLKKYEAKFSLYNQLQIKSVGELFVQLSNMDLIVDKMVSDQKDGKVSEKDYSNWLANAKKARINYMSNKYIFPENLHDKLDALLVNLNTAGPKTAAYISRQGTLSYHWDGIEEHVSIEDAAAHAKLSGVIGGYNFIENYKVIQQAGNEVRDLIIQKYKGLD